VNGSPREGLDERGANPEPRRITPAGTPASRSARTRATPVGYSQRDDPPMALLHRLDAFSQLPDQQSRCSETAPGAAQWEISPRLLERGDRLGSLSPAHP